MLLSQDGRFVVSGWSDGIVRFHTPETGKLVHEVMLTLSNGGVVNFNPKLVLLDFQLIMQYCFLMYKLFSPITDNKIH